uniref:Uncharacterized protein n=1 Tax=Anguilla anguilla TaxID=7936 RepID=A0A0E9RGH2_ANGAN
MLRKQEASQLPYLERNQPTATTEPTLQ